MADPLTDFLPLRSLAEIGERSPNMGSRMMPVSPNVDDRRGQVLSLADLAHSAYGALFDRPLYGNSVFQKGSPVGPYGDDIDQAAQRIKFQSVLDRMRDREDARSRLEAYYQAQERGG